MAPLGLGSGFYGLGPTMTSDNVAVIITPTGTAVRVVSGIQEGVFACDNSVLQSTFRASFTIAFWIKVVDGQPSSNQTLFGTLPSSNCIFELYTDGKLTFTFKGNSDKETDDDSASSADIKSASKNIMFQLQKVLSLKGGGKLQITKTTRAAGKSDYSKTKGSGYIEFSNGKKEKVDLKVAKADWDKYNLIRRPVDKQKFQAKVAKSYKDMLAALKESIDEGKEKGPRQLIDPNKEVMVVKRNKVIVIDKKDQSKYEKQGWDLAEEKETILDRIDKKIQERKNG